MPMDNDDNDTTHHNLQLAGEGRARFSSTLRPYDFPKFDFDDNLQGHLRFDSLVETEVFLGIQSQEDNQWIEDFSRGSNGMEFNSTPADSCSIPRRNNVWSEATSSESVEMLLKSVGQEDTTPGTSIVPELDGTAQGTLGELVESSNNNTERKDNNDTNVTNFDTALQPGIVLEGNLASSRHMEEHVENPSVSHPMDDFPCENSGTFTNEGIHLHHAKSTSELVELKTSVEKTLDERDTLSFPSITDAVDSDIGMLSTSKDCEQFSFSVPHESFISDGQEKHDFSKTAPEESATLQGKTGVTNINTSSAVVSFGLSPGSGRDSQEASIDSGRESVDNLIKGEFVLKSSEGDDTNTPFTTSTQTVQSENALVVSDGLDNLTENCQGGSSMDVIVPHSVELGNISSGRSASSKQIIDPIVQLPCRRDNDDVEDVSASALKPESVSERSLLLMKVDEASTALDEDIGKAVVPSAVDYEHAENSLGGPQDTLATKEELGAHLLADDTNVPMQDIQVNLDQSQDEFLEHDKDVCITTVADTEVPSDFENADSRYIGTPGKYNQTQSLEVRERLVGDYAIHTLQPQTSGKQESDNVSNVATINSSTDYHEVEQSKPAAIGLLHPSNDQEEVGKSEANLHAKVCNATEVEISMAETSVVSQQHVEKIDNIPSSVPSLMTNENADLVNGGEIMDKAEAEERESGQITDFDKTSCGSPTIISSSEPSQIENNIQEKGRGYQVTNEVKGIQSTSEDMKRIDSLGDDSGFTFKVNTLPEPGKNWSPFPDVDMTKVLTETSPSSKGKTERMSSQKTPQYAKVIERETGSMTSKGTSERRGRRGSAKGTTKENVKKGNQSKGAPNNKPSDTVAVTNLPDLNSSTSSTSSSFPFRQPFSDLQQVQLRAQIFVYGSLIQGSVPDEAYMVSAFGQYEGGRDFWERTWRTATERVQNQQSTTAAETPHSQSGARVSDAVKQGSHSSKVPVTPVSRTNSKETPAAVLSPIIPLSSPLWNISTPSQNTWTSNPLLKGPVTDLQHAHTPVHSYQTPPMRTFVGHTSWSLQTGFPSPWLASPHSSSFNLSAQFRPVTMTETVKLTPIKDTLVVVTSSGKHTTSSPAVHIVSPSPASGGVTPLHEPKSITSVAPVSLDAKPRKRKKLPTLDPGQVTSVSEPQTGTKMISSVVSQPTIPVGTSTSASLSSDAILSKAAADASTFSSIELPQKSGLDKIEVVTCSEEMLSKVEEAKSKAEDAAALANAAVLHCEEMWGQLAKHKDSGLTSESEAKVASSAAAVAASVSVAKAAAAAAKLACNAALQAKLMADEAVLSDRNGSMALCSDKSCSDGNNTGTATPSSILRSTNVTNQANSILVAAKEAAKRRVEAASVASKQAENLDAIVKAAELAAAVVTQVGKIVAMGEPLPLSDLIETGPEGCLKLPQPSVVLAEKFKDRTIDQSGAVTSDKTGGIPPCINPSDSLEKRGSGTVGKDDVQLTEEPYGLSNACSLMSKHINEKNFRNEMGNETSDTSKIGIAAPQIDATMRSTNISSGSDDIAAQVVDGIKEGSCVEVFNPRSAQKSAWYTAKVLNVENGKAYVLYDYLFSEEGSENVQEWVPLGSGEDKAPSIRIGHSLQHQKKGKRRRAALADRWCAGDRVDVWIDDSWWEGVVTEKKENDETTFKVHISALGETLTVQAWNLRTSRSWINGKWIEWSSSKGQNTFEQSDTPQEKHRKLGSPIVSKSKDDEPYNLDSTLGNPEQSKLLNLSTKEIPFDIGKSTTTDNKQAARRTLRTNQQKEGSRVVFGVPKPTGKKRKFMEVSKHFSANKTDKSNEAKDTVKFAKYLMPQGAPSRGWKVPTRNDSKDKRIHESRPRVINTRKGQRTVPQREKSRSAQDAETPTDQGIDLEGSVSHDENTSNKPTEPVSAALEAPEAPLSSYLPQFQSTTSKKNSSLNSKSDRLNSGRLGPFGGKLSKTEEDKVYAANTGKSTLDVSEPRRSNRRIQPTHRLLEGLQNSMVIPKLPAVSHDKGHRNLPARGK